MAIYDNRFPFTAPRVEKAEHILGKDQCFFWDTSTDGLGLRITKTGSKAYIFQGFVHSKDVRLTIGSPSTWSLGQAQVKAREYKVMCDNGIDPRDAQKADEAKQEASRATQLRQQVTLGDIWPRYIDARRSKWGARNLQDHINLASRGGEARKRGKGLTVPGPLAALLDERLCDLSGERLAKWLSKEVETRATSAHLAFRLLRTFINWCESENDLAGLVPSGAHKHGKVRDARPKSKPKSGCLQREQLALWFDAVRKINNLVISAYLQGLLITGARREELAGLKWDDIDFRWMSMTLRDKVEGERVIPLTPYLAYLLNALPRRNKWVFSSPTAESGRIQEPRIPHNKALKPTGLPHLTMHDLRRSFSTLSEWCEVPAGIAAQIMGHKPSATAEKHYIRRPLDLLRVWHNKIEAWMLDQATIEYDSSDDGATLRLVGIK